MENDIQLFNFNGSKVRTLIVDDKPYFVGKDVARILGYQNPSRDINRHVESEDRQNYQNGSLESNRGLTIINESGLYSLILSSKMPRAKEFKHWVTSEVLPSIRKHGAYVTNDLAVKLTTDPTELGQFLQNIGKQVDQLQQTNTKLKKQIDDEQPDVRFSKSITASNHYIGMQEMSDILKQNGFDIGRNYLFELLRKAGLLSKQGRAKNLPTKKAMNLNLFYVVHKFGSDGKPHSTTLVSPHGQKYLVNKALNGSFDAIYNDIMTHGGQQKELDFN